MDSFRLTENNIAGTQGVDAAARPMFTISFSSPGIPAALGSQAAAASLGVALSTEDVARQGSVTEPAPATDTASSGANGRLQRLAQRLTTLIGQIPAALGGQAAAASLGVALSTEDVARQGIVTEAPPATDTASSGANGRLQRLAQRLTTLIGQIPAALGGQTRAASLSVVAATDGFAVSGDVASAVADSGNPVKIGGKASTTALPAVTANQRVNAWYGLNGGAVLQAPSATSTAVSFEFTYIPDMTGQGRPLATLGFNYNGSTLVPVAGDVNGAYVVAKPVTAGGVSIARLVASAGANIKNAAGQIYGGTVTNSNAAMRYLHLYNKASAATLSTDTPVATFALPPSATVQITTDGLGAAFATGISWAFTTDDIAIPTTAGATTDIHGTLFYK